jgi:hypothetical protein
MFNLLHERKLKVKEFLTLRIKDRLTMTSGTIESTDTWNLSGQKTIPVKLGYQDGLTFP